MALKLIEVEEDMDAIWARVFEGVAKASKEIDEEKIKKGDE